MRAVVLLLLAVLCVVCQRGICDQWATETAEEATGKDAITAGNEDEAREQRLKERSCPGCLLQRDLGDMNMVPYPVSRKYAAQKSWNTPVFAKEGDDNGRTPEDVKYDEQSLEAQPVMYYESGDWASEYSLPLYQYPEEYITYAVIDPKAINDDVEGTRSGKEESDVAELKKALWWTINDKPVKQKFMNKIDKQDNKTPTERTGGNEKIENSAEVGNSEVRDVSMEYGSCGENY